MPSHRWSRFAWLITATCLTGQTGGDRYPVVIDGKVGFIDSRGNVAITPQFSPVADMAHFEDGLAPVVGPDGAGYIDIVGRFVIGPNLHWGQPRTFHEGIAAVLIWGENGAATTQAFIDRTGKVLFSIVGARGYGYVAEGLMPLEDAGKWGFVDKTFAWAIPPTYDFAHEFSDGLAPVQMGGRWGYIDKAGSQIVHPKYGVAWPFSDGLGRIRNDIATGEEAMTMEGPRQVYRHRYGFVDSDGREVIPPQFEWATNFREGKAIVTLPGSRRSGIIDKKGRVVHEAEYDQASEFLEGLAAVSVDGKWGYVDTSGRWIIAPQFSGADEFWHDLARVAWKDGHGYIDRSGTVVWRATTKKLSP